MLFSSIIVLTKRLNCEETSEELLRILGESPFHIEGAVEWLACWTQAQKGLRSNRSRDAVG